MHLEKWACGACCSTALFGIASALLAIFYGAALDNVIRGVPLAGGWILLPASVD